MLAHPEWVERLSAYKLALLRQYRDDYYGYERAKAPMVEEILRQARGETSPPAPVSGEGEEPPYEASGRP
jgi:hypothetical protein